MNKEKIVALINSLSIEACIHGADAGGSYNQNEEGLIKALTNIKTYFELDEYSIGEIKDNNGWYSYGFVKYK